MPSLDEKVTQSAIDPPLLRLLFYGSPKTRKTWLAGTAAEAGFNVVLLDSDHGYHILLKNIQKSARKRLQVVECRDNLKTAVAAGYLTRLLKFGKVNFNDKTRTIVDQAKNLDSDCSTLNISRHLDKNTVLVIDSYTALVRSIQLSFTLDNKVDPSAKFDPKKPGLRDAFGWTGALATWMLDKISLLPCHVILIGHKSVYEKYSKDQKTIEWVRVQLKSTSGPHAMTIGDKFTDILYFENASSTVTKVSTRAEKDAEGGSRLIPPASYNWDDLKFKKICEFAGIHLPSKDLPLLDFSLTDADKATSLVTKKPAIKTGGVIKAKVANPLMSKKTLI